MSLDAHTNQQPQGAGIDLLVGVLAMPVTIRSRSLLCRECNRESGRETLVGGRQLQAVQPCHVCAHSNVCCLGVPSAG